MSDETDDKAPDALATKPAKGIGQKVLEKLAREKRRVPAEAGDASEIDAGIGEEAQARIRKKREADGQNQDKTK